MLGCPDSAWYPSARLYRRTAQAIPTPIPPGLVPPGLVPPGLVPPGLVPPGLVPPGLVPPGLASRAEPALTSR